jgi:formamidase
MRGTSRCSRVLLSSSFLFVHSETSTTIHTYTLLSYRCAGLQTWAKKASVPPQRFPSTNQQQSRTACTYVSIHLPLLPSSKLKQNRWHPDNPSFGTIKNNEVVKIECVDWTGGQIGNNDSADDMRDVDLTKIHYLTGPFDIETAEPGDVLVVEIQDVQPMQDQPWGFTGIFSKDNGGGFLDEIYPKPYAIRPHNAYEPRKLTLRLDRRAKAIWDFEGIFCSSRHIPGVRFAGLIHPGILGCAPSADVLETWNKREGELISTHTHLNRTVAEPPNAKNVHAGSATGDLKEKIGKEGARTIPGRPEHGGNCDIKNLSRGSKVFLPVHVKGAKFSVGDLHFSQGDG